MAYTLSRTVSFGIGKVGLATVGYQLKNTDGTNNGGRITAGVVELGGGEYGAPVSVPDSFRGFILWDTGEGTPAYASEQINIEEFVGTITANKVADHVLKRPFGTARTSADGDAESFRSLLGAIAKLVNRVAVAGATLNIYKEDDATLMGTQTLTTNSAAEPITSADTN